MRRTARSLGQASALTKMGVHLGRWDRWRVRRLIRRGRIVKAQRIIMRSVGR